MDGSQFPAYLWESSSETQRRPPPLVNAASVAGGLSSFEFPADYDPSAIPSMDPTGFFAHPLPPDLFPFHPELPASASNRTSGTTAQSSPSGMIFFQPAATRPLPLVQVQEIYLMTAMVSRFCATFCRSHLLRQQLMRLRTLQARGVHLHANARKRSRLSRLPALPPLPANVGRSSRIHWLDGWCRIPTLVRS
ncbi:hypothetical protein B0H13DRAFT_2020310 [Mycena leptocephala]|nr:hypothetical protein B0H13DRAFT_2020310 [Mycena leptocephala]